MPNSLRCRLKNLVRKGLLSEKDLERIIITNPMSKKEESMLLSNVYNEGYNKGYEKAKAEYKPKECDDCVSRQVIKEQMLKYGFHAPDMTVTEFVEDLPPVLPKREQGEWIEQSSNKEQGEREHIWWKCSQCGQVIFSETEIDRKEFHAFCSKCGAEMKGVEE